MRYRRSVAVILSAFLSAPAFSGCGSGDQPETGQVTGIVRLNGEPLAGLTVQFVPDKGRSSAGETDEHGRYELIYSSTIAGAKVGPQTVWMIVPENSALEKKLKRGLPEKYHSKSELKVDVKGGSNVFNFDLTR